MAAEAAVRDVSISRAESDDVVVETGEGSSPKSTVESQNCNNNNATPSKDAAIEQEEEELFYNALIIDSGPIIRMTGLSLLRNRAKEYYTVPAVLQEIRDAKARQHLEQLPFTLIPKEPSPEGIQAVVDFSRQTGDYQSLSAVDLQVLGLLYDLESEGCKGDIGHIRKTPKRAVGVGKIESLGSNQTEEHTKSNEEVVVAEEEKEEKTGNTSGGVTFFQAEPAPKIEINDTQASVSTGPAAPKTWAMLVNPTAANKAPPTEIAAADNEPSVLNVPFGSMKLAVSNDIVKGQFSDAEEDIDEQVDISGDESDDEGYAASDAEISDEECDVYILDPDEVEERKQEARGLSKEVQEELQSDFPSLGAALNVPYDGSDGEGDGEVTPAVKAKQEADLKREKAIKPVTVEPGKLYNPFGKYKDLAQPKMISSVEKPVEKEQSVEEASAAVQVEPANDGQTRIMGGMAMAGQGIEVEDDGEGWITCTNDIRKMKATGKLNPNDAPGDENDKATQQVGPPISQRAACATTDFAMQNVILQMNLELLSVDGMKVRRLKSWVSRCGACFKIYTDGDSSGPYNGGKRLFCSRCGSDMIQRVAASVDSKTGRLRLHLSKKYKTSKRGTKFSLPKAGTNNRFQGDLLLREDQLMMGAWNQKVKKMSGGKSRRDAQSIFGHDLASNVGCHAKIVNQDDIRVGFGRRNPNATKGGRERRGKKKKSGDKACGLRRY